MLNICIIGGGNIGTALACYFKHYNQKLKLSLLTNHSEKFSDYIVCNDIERKEKYTEKNDFITNDVKQAVTDSDIVFITVPHFLIETVFRNIAPYVKANAMIGVIPGYGGCEFVFHKYFSADKTLFGFQRVPFIAKLVKYGSEVDLKSWKPSSVVGCIPNERILDICQCINKCGLNTRQANNYLSIALTPSNSLLHTARIYDLFKENKMADLFIEMRKLYVGWTNHTSDILLAMDAELHQLLDAIPELDTSAIKPLLQHYGVSNKDELTQKINSIPSFQAAYGPFKEDRLSGKYCIDLESRLFQEDFPWGLAIIKAYCDIFEVSSPMIDQVLKWYEEFFHLEWFVDGKFIGNDVINTGIPQNYGYLSRRQIVNMYK